MADRDALSSEIEPAFETYLKDAKYSQCHVDPLDLENKGSFGRVFKITDKITNEVKVVKVMKNVADFNTNDALKESNIMHTFANKSSEANIIKVYGSYVQNPQLSEGMIDEMFKESYLCIEMEYCPNGSLSSLFKEEKPSESILCQIMKQITNAISHCHENDIIHNDIKPNNILVLSYNEELDSIQVVLSDFGQFEMVRELVDDDYTYSSQTNHLYPDNEKPSFSADIYALATSVFELVTKKKYSYKNKIIKKEFNQAGIFNEYLINLLLSMMSKQESERPKCTQILNSIDAIISNINNYSIVSSFDNRSDLLNTLITELGLEHDVRLESQFTINKWENQSNNNVDFIKFIKDLKPPEEIKSLGFTELFKQMDTFTEIDDECKGILIKLKKFYSNYKENLESIDGTVEFKKFKNHKFILTTELSNREGEFYRITERMAKDISKPEGSEIKNGSLVLCFETRDILPSREYALNSLYKSLEIETVNSALVVIHDTNKNAQFIQVISHTITDYITAEAMLEKKYQINATNFSFQVFGKLLTFSNNDDFILKQINDTEHRLISINNRKSFNSETECNSILFSLKEMENMIDENLILFIKMIDIDVLLSDWTNDLIQNYNSYIKLWKSIRFIKDDQQFWEQSDIPLSNLSPNTILRIVKRFQSIKEIVSDNYTITLKQLFEKCCPKTRTVKKINPTLNDTEQYLTFIPSVLYFKNYFRKFSNSEYADTVFKHLANLINSYPLKFQKEISKAIKSINNIPYCGAEYFCNKIGLVASVFSKGLLNLNYKQEWKDSFSKFRKGNSELNWYLLLEEYFPRGWKNSKLQFDQVKGAFSDKRTLSNELVEAIFDEEKQFKKDDDLSGRADTCRFPKSKPLFYFKKYPEFPCKEYAATLFMRELGMKQAPHSELFKFYDPKTKEQYPVLVLEAVDGETIEKVWRDDSIFSNLDYYQTSLLILSSLFLNPEDQKEDNLVLLEGMYIIPVDNDRNFLTDIIYSKDILNTTINVDLQCKSLAFCLNEMNKPFHSKIVRFIKSTNVSEFIQNWLTKLSNTNHSYQKLFSSTINKNNLRKKGVKLNFEISTGFLVLLFYKFTMLKSIITEKTTPYQFLKISQPLLATYYVQQNIPKKELFLQITSKYYQPNNRSSTRTTVNNSKQLIKIQTSSSSSNNLWKTEAGPKELLTIFKNIEAKYDSEINTITKYLSGDYGENNSEKEIINDLFYNDTIITIVSIKDSNKLKNQFFKNKLFFNKCSYIKVLDLRNASNLTEETLLLLQNCASLEYLNISDWKITKFGNYKKVQKKILSPDIIELDTSIVCFLNLKRLVLNNCKNLELVNFKQDSVQCIDFDNCEKLNTVELLCQNLSILQLNNTNNISKLNVQNKEIPFKTDFTNYNSTCDNILANIKSRPQQEKQKFWTRHVRRDHNIYEKINDESLQKNTDFVTQLLIQNYKIFKYIDDSLKTNTDFILGVITKFNKEFSTDDMKQFLASIGNRNVYLEVVKKQANLFNLLSDSLKADNDFVLTAILMNSEILKFITDLNVIAKAVVSSNNALFDCLDIKFKKNETLIKKLITKDHTIFQLLDESLKTDERFILNLLSCNPKISGYLEKQESLKKHIIEKVKNNELNFEDIDDKLKKDKDFITKLVLENNETSILLRCDATIRNDYDLMKKVASKNPLLLEYVMDENVKQRIAKELPNN